MLSLYRDKKGKSKKLSFQLKSVREKVICEIVGGGVGEGGLLTKTRERKRAVNRFRGGLTSLSISVNNPTRFHQLPFSLTNLN